MPVDRSDDFFSGSFHLHDQRSLADHFSSHSTDDVDTEDLTILVVKDNLNEAFRLTRSKCTAVSCEGKLTDADITVLLTCLVFGQTDHSDLGTRIDYRRSGEHLECTFVALQCVLSSDLTHTEGGVSKHLQTVDVTRSIDTLDAGLHELVDLDTTALDLEFDLTNPFEVRYTTDREQSLFSFDSRTILEDSSELA